MARTTRRDPRAILILMMVLGVVAGYAIGVAVTGWLLG
jgi:hypothetical protein